MKLTKFTHACFSVTKDDATVIVDPGNWSTDIAGLTNVIAVVVTHEHADHCDLQQIEAIIHEFPNATIYAHIGITESFSQLPTQAVTAGDTVQAGPFSLAFYGGNHAIIHPSFAPVTNLGVMINNALYYPGDSFALPQVPVQVLALPASAPWMKISEAMDFCSAINASSLVFPTHDALLSDAGKALADKLLSGVSPVYRRISEPVTIEG